MTDERQKQLEKEAVYELYEARKKLNACRVQAMNFARKFEKVASGLKTHPQSVSSTPSPAVMGGQEDYREALLSFPCRQDVLDLCDEIRDGEAQVRSAEEKIAMLASIVP